MITTDKAPRIDMNKGGPMMRDRENTVIVWRVKSLNRQTAFQSTTRKNKRVRTKDKTNNTQNFFLSNEKTTNLISKSTIDISILFPDSFLSQAMSFYLKVFIFTLHQFYWSENHWEYSLKGLKILLLHGSFKMIH